MKIKANIAVSDSGFLFDPTTGDSYSLNQVGLEFFRMMKEGKNKKEIQKTIIKKYEIDDATFDKSYFDFENMLRYNQLIIEDE